MLKDRNTPVLLIGYNRPDLTKRVLKQIKKFKPNKLYFAVDGANNDIDKIKVNEVKKIVNEIDWKCEVKTLFAHKNFGCKYGPVRAMNWFFDNEEMGIILEDDVLMDKSFFRFASKLLKLYKVDKRVGSISGNNFQFGMKRGDSSFYFSRYSHSCGWATWRRVWKLYDVEIKDYEKYKSVVLRNVFPKWIDRLYWILIFSGIKSGEIDSAWDYQWSWMMWKNELLGIIPNVNLVKNIGFGRSDATHTKLKSRFAEQLVEPMTFPLVIPTDIKRNIEADDFTQRHSYSLWKEGVMNLVRKFRTIKRKSICLF